MLRAWQNESTFGEHDHVSNVASFCQPLRNTRSQGACARTCLHRVDPANVQLRQQNTIRRRVYHVAGPNSLYWHIDGNHKLIWRRIVVHGGTDGFSRLCVFMRASLNNLAATVAHEFLGATAESGWPSRERTDHGREDVARLICRNGGGATVGATSLAAPSGTNGLRGSGEISLRPLVVFISICFTTSRAILSSTRMTILKRIASTTCSYLA